MCECAKTVYRKFPCIPFSRLPIYSNLYNYSALESMYVHKFIVFLDLMFACMYPRHVYICVCLYNLYTLLLIFLFLYQQNCSIELHLWVWLVSISLAFSLNLYLLYRFLKDYVVLVITLIHTLLVFSIPRKLPMFTILALCRVHTRQTSPGSGPSFRQTWPDLY